MSEMISFGAGVNSVAMTILLVNDGWQGPIVFADPGAEHPDTYCYIEYFEREWLRPRGLEVTRICPKLTPEWFTKGYQIELLEKCHEKNIVPIMHLRWCTTEYKRRPISRWAKANDIDTMLLGIAADERHRASRANSDGLVLDYPLVYENISRIGCKSIIIAEGLSVPPRSGCWICPFRSLSDWRELYDLRHDLFDRAVALDNAAIIRSQGTASAQLTEQHGMSLEMIGRMWDAQLELPLMPEPEYEYQMCECRL